MKRPDPDVSGNTDAERFDNAVRKFVTVPKEALLEEEARLKRQRARRRAKKPV